MENSFPISTMQMSQNLIFFLIYITWNHHALCRFFGYILGSPKDSLVTSTKFWQQFINVSDEVSDPTSSITQDRGQ